MASRYSRRSARKRRRRRRVILAVFGALLALVAGGVFLLNIGLPTFSISNGSTAFNSDRFEGLSGIVIPPHENEELWWTSIDSQDISELPAVLGSTVPNSKYSRILVPADVLFASDKSQLNNAAKQSVADVAATITNPLVKVIVVCHSAHDSAVGQGRILSEERADSFANALEVEMQREAGSIERIGLGDSSPLPNVDPNTPTGRALNRRCEVFIELLG